MKNKTTTINKAVENREERLTLSEGRDMFYEKFRRNSRILRASENMSGVELANNLSLQSGHRILDLEYGRANPTVEELSILCKYYNLSIDDILYKSAIIEFK